ncbi:MAG: DUF6092 family protein [Thermoplasmata archaeon]
MTNMEEILNNKHFQLLSFLITSARGCVDEPPIYGPLRLLDASSKVIDIMEKEGITNETILKIKYKIQMAMDIIMTNENEFVKIVDDITKDLGDFISHQKV